MSSRDLRRKGTRLGVDEAAVQGTFSDKGRLPRLHGGTSLHALLMYTNVHKKSRAELSSDATSAEGHSKVCAPFLRAT